MQSFSNDRSGVSGVPGGLRLRCQEAEGKGKAKSLQKAIGYLHTHLSLQIGFHFGPLANYVTTVAAWGHPHHPVNLLDGSE